MRQSKLLSAVLSLLSSLFILTSSIAVPILLRPFYYAHITPLNLESATGLSRRQIIRSYDEILDYCTGRSANFSVGGLPWSLSGKEHFSDVRNLFLLDLSTAELTGLLLLFWSLFHRRFHVQPYRFRNRSFVFWGCIGLWLVFGCIGILIAVDFSRAFIVFHTLFFPNKYNWLFDFRADPIILLLPQTFFRSCALLVFMLLVLQCAIAILWELRKTK